MSCTPALTCKAALNEATRLAPNRNKASDGICASAAHHQQNPTSDHETGDAFDLTHDPANGCDVDVLFARIIARRDARVKYLIRSRRILRAYDKPGIPAWTWAPYTGPNPHDKHGHCSIYAVARNDVSPWFHAPPPPLPPTGGKDMFGPKLGDKTGADDSQVINIDGVLYLVAEGDSAAAYDAAKVDTVLIGSFDYATLKKAAVKQ